MPAERFFIEDPLEQGSTLSIQGEEFHHLAHVFRMKPQEHISLVNGRGCLAEAVLQKIGKHEAIALIEESHFTPKSHHELVLLQAIPRQPRLEYIVEKAVELGVTKLWLFPGELSEKKDLTPSGLERIHHILISALKQCGRLFLPELVIQPKLSLWKTIPEIEHFEKRKAFFGDTRLASPPLLERLLPGPHKAVLLAIGPEKGFHTNEVMHMEHVLKIEGIHLHENILRTDTAAIAALAIASALMQSSTKL